ncbi:MAG: hypothetical protein ACI4XR_04370 [Bacilli bacterium]
MREGIGGIQLFLIVVILILIFAGIMSLTINHSNAFAVKDQLVSIIEDAGGLDITAECRLGSCNDDIKDQQTLQSIIDALDSYSYRQTGDCDSITISDTATIVGYQRTGEITMTGKKSSFCIAKIDANKDDGTLRGYYYKVYVFYQLDIPVLHSIFNFRSIGETKLLYR